MRTIAFVGIAAVVVALAATITACDKTPTRPSSLPLPNQGPPPVTFTRLEIIGPRTVAPGQSVQFQAIGHKPDGTTEDVTSTAFWQSSRSNVLTISPGGLAMARTRGESTLQARFVATSTTEIVVVPAGTYRLIGSVEEADSPTAPVIGARVEVTGGDPSAMTDGGGRYRLYGVPGNAEIRITKEGYQPHVQNLALAEHRMQNFALTLAAPRADLAGTYTLTISVADHCRQMLPEEVWTRRYTAALSQQGAFVAVDLTGATFVVDRNGIGDGFRGRVEPGQAVFSLTGYDYYYYRTASDVTEEISTSLYLTIGGLVTAAVAPNRISGALSGEIATLTTDPRMFPRRAASCRSVAHQFQLAR